MGRAPGAGLAGARASWTLAGWGDPLTGSVLLSQRVTWLQGTLSFLLTLKCIHLVSVQGTTASCSFLMRRSLAGAFAAAVRGLPGRRAQAVPSRWHFLERDAAYAGLSRDSLPKSSQPRVAGQVLPRRQERGTNASDAPDSGPAPRVAPVIARSRLASYLLPLPHGIVPQWASEENAPVGVGARRAWLPCPGGPGFSPALAGC